MPLMPTQWGKWEWEMTSPGKTTVGQNGARFAESWRRTLVNANPKSMKLQQCGRMCIRVSSLQYGTASHTSWRMCHRELPGNGFFITHGMMGEKYLAADGIRWIRSRACSHWGDIPGAWVVHAWFCYTDRPQIAHRVPMWRSLRPPRSE